ncbi:MAG: hypothetical protein HRF50_16000 [Phycisphaerae bacterium]|jgi:DNA polymerase-3 subunit epsilon
MNSMLLDSAWLHDALPKAHSWPAADAVVALAELPNSPAVLLFVDADGHPVQLLTSQTLRRVALARLTAAAGDAPTARADLAAVVRGVRWRDVTSAFEATWWYYRVARRLHPEDYRRRIGFGPAWYLHVDWTEPLPEIRVTERVWMLCGSFVGPWPTQRGCQQCLETLWDLFELCRHPEQYRRAPHGERCAYYEMGRCDAPCDGTAPSAAMIERTRAAWRFACGARAEWIEDATQRMHRAAGQQRFEQAGLLKRQIAHAEDWQARFPGMRLIDDSAELLLVPAVRRRAWKPFVHRAGALEDGPLLKEREAPQQVAAWIEQQRARLALDVEPAIRMEQSWLVARYVGRENAQTVMRIAPLEGLSASVLAQRIEATIAQARSRLPNSGESTAGPG